MSFSDDLKAWIESQEVNLNTALSLSSNSAERVLFLESDLKSVKSGIDNLEANLHGVSDAVGRLSSQLDSLTPQLTFLAGAAESFKIRLGELEDRMRVLEENGPGEPEEPTDPVDPPVDPPPTPPVKTPPTIPADAITIPLYVRESSSVSRSRAFVSTGVPIAESLNLTDISRLTLLDSQGFPIAADFRPTSYWRTAKSSNGIQWVQVSFFDKFDAAQEKQYKLVITPSRWLDAAIPFDAAQTLKAAKTGDLIIVTSNSNMWAISGDGISLDRDSNNIYHLTKSTLKFDGVEGLVDWRKTRRLEIEYAGPLVCYIQVETETNLKFGDQLTTRPSIGKDPATGKPIYPQGSIVVSRRYEFRVGSGTVMCQQVVKFEGTKNGTNWLDKDGVKVNGVLGELWQDTFTLASKPKTLLTQPSSDPLSHWLSIPDVTTRVTQNLRPNRLAKRSYTTDVGGAKDVGESADSRIVAALYTDSEQALVFGLYHMDKYEPQAISYDPATSSISVSYASDRFWLAHHQGVSVRSVIALEDESRLDEVHAELNHPLRLLAQDSAYYSVAGLGAIPSGPKEVDFVGSLLDSYEAALKSICQSTLFNIDRFGLYGLMTYAGLPRYWGENNGGDEVGQLKDNHANAWDDVYKWAALTDYYSSSRTATTLALLSGDSTYLDLLSIPSADRMLHTQIFTGSPDDKWGYIGWAPTGYGCYRSDFNSSHSYYENLYWYYYLTGDRQVVDIISRGENHFINALKTTPLGGRHPHQHIGAMRFLKHAHYDQTQAEKYGAAYESIMLRAIDECYVEGTYNGEVIGLWVDGKKKPNAVNVTLNHYAGSIWDMESLYLFSLERPDLSGRINDIIVKTAKTVIKYGPKLVGGDGTITGKWSRTFKFFWNGLEVQSIITDLANKNDPGDITSGVPSLLYDMDKPGMVAHWVRAGKISGDVELIKKSEELVQHAIASIIKSKLPMGKLMGLCECRLVAAVGTMQGRR